VHKNNLGTINGSVDCCSGAGDIVLLSSVCPGDLLWDRVCLHFIQSTLGCSTTISQIYQSVCLQLARALLWFRMKLTQLCPQGFRAVSVEYPRCCAVLTNWILGGVSHPPANIPSPPHPALLKSSGSSALCWPL